MSPGRGELEDNLSVSDQAELISGEPFDGFGILFEVLDFELQLACRLHEFGVFGAYLSDLGLKGAKPREPFGGKHQNGGTDRGHGEDEQRQNALDKQGDPGHVQTVPRK